MANAINLTKIAAIYGSRKTLETHRYYQSAMELSRRLVKIGYIVRTGGGSGIMEAANRGAHSVDPTKSEGVSLRQIIKREPINAFITSPGCHDIKDCFSERKAAIAKGISIAIFYPGSTGTFDEFFDLLDVIKCGIHETLKIKKDCLIICVGYTFWDALRNFHVSVGIIFPEFVNIVDTVDDVIQLLLRD